MPHAQSQRRRSSFGALFVVVILLLLAWNVRVFALNQRKFAPEDQVRRRPRGIGAMLAQNPMGVVKDTFSMYHQLRVLAGKTLVLPERWGAHAFMLERLSRIHVELSPDRRVLPIATTDRLYAHADRHLAIDSSTQVEVFLDPAATRYVLIEREPAGLAIIASEALYERERASQPTP